MFALGGILCAIRTGAAPFSGTTAIAVVKSAVAGDLSPAFAALDASGAHQAELLSGL